MDLDTLSDMALRLANEHEAFVRAKDDKAMAEDTLLKLVVDAVKPALPALSSKVPQGAGPIGRAVKVIMLSSTFAAQDDHTIGPGLYLGEQGDWFMLDPKVVGGESVLVPMVLSIDDVLDKFDLVTIIVGLVNKIRAQLGSRDKSTTAIKAETDRLQAVATLLAPVKR